MSSMLIHCGAEEATIHDLKAVVLPENHPKYAGKSGRYGTVSHDRLVNSVKSMAEYAFGEGCIVDEQYALSGGRVYPGARLFGMMRFDFGLSEVDKAIKAGKLDSDVVFPSDADKVRELLSGVDLGKLNIEDQNTYLNMENDQARLNFMVERGQVALEHKDPVEPVALDDDRIYPALAIRNSYDRSMSVGAAVGYQVFVCDNLCLSGEVAFSRKHTVNAMQDVVMVLWSLLQSMKSQHEFDQRWRNFAKEVEITEKKGFEILGWLAGKGALQFEGGNKSQLAIAMNQWRTPSNTIFADNSLWALENAVTFAQRHSGITRRLESGNNVIRELRAIADPEKDRWNTEADEIFSSYKNVTAATVLDLIEVISAGAKKKQEQEAAIYERVADLSEQ